ncbi:MAG: type II toxin-antitoxin system PemK/MazF family toxin [Methanomicrobium sp.]|nr:type II toxin-antitoxin system PemK/MazF family toxin [Methanomicrobium sp.]
MPEYFPGDVVLAPLRLDSRNEVKTRPAVVISSDGNFIRLYPVTSRIPKDSPPVTLELDDFEKGGLSLFDESFIIISQILTIRSSEIIGKKGRLTREKISYLSSIVSDR